MDFIKLGCGVSKFVMGIQAACGTLKNFVFSRIFLIFLLSLLLLATAFWNCQQKTINGKLKQNFFAQQSRLTGIVCAYEETADQFFSDCIQTGPVLALLHKILVSSVEQREVLRQQLHELLSAHCEQMQLYGGQHLHFHDRQGDLLLRFRDVNAYLDLSAPLRPSLEQVRSTQMAVHGYESGRIYLGYRNVYPLKWQGQYLGSVEISKSVANILKTLGNKAMIPSVDIIFAIHDQDFLNGLLPGQKQHYIPSLLHQDYVCQQQLPPVSDCKNPSEAVQRILAQDPLVQHNMARQETFWRYPIIQNQQRYAAYFHSVKNIAGEHIAFIVFIQHGDVLWQEQKVAMLVFSICALLLLLLFIHYYRAKCSRCEKERTAELLVTISENMGEAMYSTDMNGDITFINPAALLLLDCENQQALGKNARQLFCPKDGSCSEGCVLLKPTTNGRAFYRGQTTFGRCDGKLVEVEFYCTAMVVRRHVVGAVTIFHDVSKRLAHERVLLEMTQQLEISNRELTRLARVDALTEVANRRVFDEGLPLQWKMALRSAKPLSLLMIDIDFFKAYNDLYGHQQGDKCLKLVAKILMQSCKRPADLVTRYGGEEFAVILPETDAANACQVAKRIQQCLSEQMIKHEGSSVNTCVTVSIGISTLIASPTFDEFTLLTIADQQLYRAKAQGRNQICRCAEYITDNRLQLKS
ncbi:MAG: diguanylate cyclase [Deltaproteobacteria bacterium]|nr:diguanylate cyclase [Deltaproteobacteria bacterium]